MLSYNITCINNTGPEKTLEVIFKSGVGAPGGLRNMTRAQLDELCTQAKCTILSQASTNYIDAYVLSESSLFIYEYRLIMKTCGTTTLLRCLGTLFEYSDALAMQLSWVGYSRKNFLFPSAQLWPHVNFGEEMRYIEQHESLQKRLRGDGHILGPVTGDHWFVYVAEGCALSSPDSPRSSPVTTPGAMSSYSSVLDLQQARSRSASDRMVTCSDSELTSGDEMEDSNRRANRINNTNAAAPVTNTTISTTPVRPQQQAGSKAHGAMPGAAELSAALSLAQPRGHSTYRTFNMMMFDMAPEVAATFFQGTNGLTGKEMTAKAGIQALCPGAYIDEAAFTPCGYSMNSVLDAAYSTIHITPEAACSYVSFETNDQLDDYAPLLRRVLSTFRPQRFVLTMFGDDDAIDCLDRLPTSKRQYGDIAGCPQTAYYLRTSSTATTVEAQRQKCIMACYSYQPNAPFDADAGIAAAATSVEAVIIQGVM